MWARRVHPLKPIMHIAYFPPISRKFINFLPPIFTKTINFPVFCNLRLFCLIYFLLACPYFDHEAFMPHTLHVLDASDGGRGWMSPSGSATSIYLSDIFLVFGSLL